jgi:hypothetical protein
MNDKYVICWRDDETKREGKSEPMSEDWAVKMCAKFNHQHRGSAISHWVREATEQEVSDQKERQELLATGIGGFSVPDWVRDAIVTGAKSST